MKHFFKSIQRFLMDRPLRQGVLIKNRYEIDRVLGMGSYGITYLAKDQKLGTQVVVKQLRNTKQKLDQGMRAFQYEKKILARINHPQVPQLLDVEESSAGFFIIMDYINGKTFEDLIFEHHYKYKEEDVVQILLQVIEVIESLHNEGIVHRDLRIPNILKVDDVIYIIDFGLARFIGDDEQVEGLVTEQQYMRRTTVQSDVYALGHFALFLLYSSYEPNSRKEKSWEEELLLSPELTAIIRKMLQSDGYYEDMMHLKGDLQFIADKKTKALNF
ncbi:MULTISPECIES: serine/threonine protein kinase [Priestia]|uniref:Serine/threonine-protein kinase n=2 Tax=Priestia flexa TaxID=86664 RepID=A0ABU4JA58_9BACI|nr:serine/threonine-protein kinase [Priestia flexa]MBY6087431.1 serine/threonine protein kinase [Priestia flexa]MCA1203105.1 serine/threonine protein kinase [Priestia flexa]MCG7313241.1 serine/threonine protein kinase [Priestia flexa]MCM3066132.1 serine/threonine protein kinase [Priestia flexa]MDW8517885.1 serine/threonine-protein kinase [Priestia flexa]